MIGASSAWVACGCMPSQAPYVSAVDCAGLCELGRGQNPDVGTGASFRWWHTPQAFCCKAPLIPADMVCAMCALLVLLSVAQSATALEGAALIRSLVEARATHGGPVVMAGGGIRGHNVAEVIKQTGVKEVHGTGGEQPRVGGLGD